MRKSIGAHLKANNICTFTVWAPTATTVTLQLVSPKQQSIPMHQDPASSGYWEIALPGIEPGARYQFKVDQKDARPDPASLSQPETVHGPSDVVDLHHYAWRDKDWKGIALEKMVIYELHVGTFTQQGTFEGVISKLDYLVDLGINAIEVMPISQFPGNRNWGYDGVYPFAVQDSYGGFAGFQKLVDACHHVGIAVVLDVVYNHMGPEGNYLNDFGPYFTDKYATPWGKALNFDDAYCDGARNFFIENACMWFEAFHVDALRLDAVHAIKDFGAKHFLQELSDEVNAIADRTGRHLVLIGESDLNDPKFISPRKKGGYGLDGQWVDEFHHALHGVLTGESQGYYEDFGSLQILKKAYEETYVYNGIYSPHRKKKFGASAAGHNFGQFIVFAQNHDQVGNRMLGERLSSLVSFEALKLAAGAFLLSPYVPMLFMGEEYGETNPFQYFINHTDPGLVKAVREGRASEFKAFHSKGTVPDPQSEETFQKSTLQWNLDDARAKVLFQLYKTLIHFRSTHPAFDNFDRKSFKVSIFEEKGLLILEKTGSKSSPPIPLNTLITILNFSSQAAEISFGVKDEIWKKILDSSDAKWQGDANLPSSGKTDSSAIIIQSESFILFERD